MKIKNFEELLEKWKDESSIHSNPISMLDFNSYRELKTKYRKQLIKELFIFKMTKPILADVVLRDLGEL